MTPIHLLYAISIKLPTFLVEIEKIIWNFQISNMKIKPEDHDKAMISSNPPRMPMVLDAIAVQEILGVINNLKNHTYCSC